MEVEAIQSLLTATDMELVRTTQQHRTRVDLQCPFEMLLKSDVGFSLPVSSHVSVQVRDILLEGSQSKTVR